MTEEIIEYDERGNIVYHKAFNGYKVWKEYDENNNLVHSKNYKGYERWYKYDENDKRINITQQKIEQIKAIEVEKEFLSREEIPRFDLMEL